MFLHSLGKILVLSETVIEAMNRDGVFRKGRYNYMLFVKLLNKPKQAIKHSQLPFTAVSYWKVVLKEMRNNHEREKSGSSDLNKNSFV